MPKKPKSQSNAGAEKKKRNAIFVTLDDEAEELLQRFLATQRIKPDRAAVAYTALVEWLKRELGESNSKKDA